LQHRRPGHGGGGDQLHQRARGDVAPGRLAVALEGRVELLERELAALELRPGAGLAGRHHHPVDEARRDGMSALVGRDRLERRADDDTAEVEDDGAIRHPATLAERRRGSPAPGVWPGGVRGSAGAPAPAARAPRVVPRALPRGAGTRRAHPPLRRDARRLLRAHLPRRARDRLRLDPLRRPSPRPPRPPPKARPLAPAGRPRRWRARPAERRVARGARGVRPRRARGARGAALDEESRMIEWSEQHELIRETFRRLVEAEIKPNLRELEHGDTPPYAVLRRMMATFGIDQVARARFERQIARDKAAAAGEPPPAER